MRRTLTIVLLTLLAGSRRLPAQAGAPQGSAAPKTAGIDTTARMISGFRGPGNPLRDSTELALIEELKALYPTAADSELFDRQLKSTTTVGMRSSNPKAQAILARIFARRKASYDSVVAAMPKPVNLGPLLHVTIALVDSLSDPKASGEIRRRIGVEPHDVILIPLANATVGAVEQAIHVLGELWKADAQEAPLKDLNVMTYGEAQMISWTQLREDLMRGQLYEAAHGPKKPLAGVGVVGFFDIVLARKPPDPAKP